MPATKKIIASYNMRENAIGLADFVSDYSISVPKADRIHVMDDEGNHVLNSELVEVTLDDGSKVYNLVLKMDR